jgi:hypothetical protein
LQSHIAVFNSFHLSLSRGHKLINFEKEILLVNEEERKKQCKADDKKEN